MEEVKMDSSVDPKSSLLDSPKTTPSTIPSEVKPSGPTTYVDKKQLEDAVDALIKLMTINSQASNEKKKRKKPSLLDTEYDRDKQVLVKHEKIRLMVSFKQTPPNKSTYINLLPLPHPFDEMADLKICLIVQDLKPKKPLKDRELDLNLTREHYRAKFLAAGVSEDLLSQRLFILPMRELLTEYRVDELKNKLVRSYDIFLCERRLMNDKFKLLPRFLGSKFWIERKKFPVPVDTKATGAKLHKSLMKAIAKTSLFITGKSPIAAVLVGYSKQTNEQLVDNLSRCLSRIFAKFRYTIQMLSLKSESSMPIPFYADLTRPGQIWRLMPQAPKGRLKTVVGEHPFKNRARIMVYPSGRTKTIKKAADMMYRAPKESTNVWLTRKKMERSAARRKRSFIRQEKFGSSKKSKNLGKSKKTKKSKKSEKSGKSEKSDKSGKSDKVKKPRNFKKSKNSEKSEKSRKVEKPRNIKKLKNSQKSEKSGKFKKPKNNEKFKKTKKPDKSEKINKTKKNLAKPKGPGKLKNKKIPKNSNKSTKLGKK